jgi:outer membrane protein assembly factor BamE (lipoprotein component of BamABCDE complex)
LENPYLKILFNSTVLPTSDVTTSQTLGGQIMRLFLIFGALLLCFSMTLGCGTLGKQFNMDQVQTIENGKTTREDIALTFGQPFKVGIQNSHPIWVYEESKYQIVGEGLSKSLIVEFDDKGVVRNHSIMSNDPNL